MATITWTLSDWAANLRYEGLSGEAIEAAKRFLYDSIGCALGGYRHEDCELLLAHLEEMSGRPDCTLIGSGWRSNAVNAALYNALATRAMDYNDIYWRADPCHPSDIIPAATSICDWKCLSGRELIVGVVLAYEMEMRYCEAADPGIREKGWHHATLTAFVSPMVAARMLGLGPGQMQNAIGIAASHSCTLGAVTAGKLTMMKNTVDPLATAAGVQAALLAERGYSGPEHVVDGKEGLVQCFGPHWHLAKLTDGLGDGFKIGDCGMKAFPTEALTHSPLTATLQIVRDHDVRPEDVAEITVETIARAADILSDPAKYRPATRETADHSMPYCLAVAIADREVTPRQFTTERINDPALHSLMDAIKAVASDEFEALFPESQPSRVTITTKNGNTYSARVDVPKGDYRDPMTVDDIGVKFDSLASEAFSSQECRWIRDAVMSLEDVENVGDFMRLLVPEPERRLAEGAQRRKAEEADQATRSAVDAAVRAAVAKERAARRAPAARPAKKVVRKPLKKKAKVKAKAKRKAKVKAKRKIKKKVKAKAKKKKAARKAPPRKAAKAKKKVARRAKKTAKKARKKTAKRSMGRKPKAKKKKTVKKRTASTRRQTRKKRR
ncbi:MAG: MmgE/PrpD family protein [Planctomycetota bacterium]